MKRNLLAAGAAALALAGGAQASILSTLDVRGSGTEFFYYGVPGGCDPDSPDYGLCSIGEADAVWAGTLQISTTAVADGTYTGADLTSVLFTSEIGGFSYKYGDQLQQCEFACDNAFTGLLPDASVTIAGGKVVSLNLTYNFETGAFIATGLGVQEEGASYGHASNTWWVSGSATPLVPIPEPSSALLMLAGLGALAVRRR